ncbi:MAG: hypothetical protein ACMXX7_02530 [Candidatus Woesearchaeota archaeon]
MNYKKISSLALTAGVVLLLIFIGPATAFNLVLGDFSNSNPVQGDIITLEAEIDITSQELINLDLYNEVRLYLNNNHYCSFSATTGAILDGCDGITPELIAILNQSTQYPYVPGYGYGYGEFDVSPGPGEGYGYGYGYGYGPGFGYTNALLRYELTFDTSEFSLGQNEVKISINLGPRNYESDTKTFMVGTPNPLNPDVGLIPDGTIEDSTSVIVNNDWTINASLDNTIREIFLPQGTEITRTGGGSVNFSELISQNVAPSILEGLTGTAGALRFGIPDYGLTFSQPITIRIQVPSTLEGQTLTALRSSTRTSGSWTQIATCVVTSSVCEFTTTQASYFAAAQGISSGSSGSGSGSTTITQEEVTEEEEAPEEEAPVEEHEEVTQEEEHEEVTPEEETLVEEQEEVTEEDDTSRNFQTPIIFLLILIVLAIGAYVYKKK